MGATYTPEQLGWRWYQNHAAEPSNPELDSGGASAAENEEAWIVTEITRLRVVVNETGGKAANNTPVTVEYSTTGGAPWTALGAANHWEIKDGLATGGDDITANLLTDGDTLGEYVETAENTVTHSADSATESDIAMGPVLANVTANTLYYFRILHEGTPVPLGAAEAYPQVQYRTAVAGTTHLHRIQQMGG